MKGTTKILALLVIVALLFAACAPAANDGGAQPAGNQELIIATGGTSGTYYPFGGAMAQVWNDNIPGMKVTAQSTGASAENLRLVNKGDADLAIVQNDVMDYAYKGTETFEGEKLEGFMAIATLYPEVVQIATTAQSGITSIEDMKGKRVSVGAAGSGVEFNSKQVFAAYGMTFDDIKKNNLSFKESSDGMQNGTLDAAFVTAGVPNTALQELATTKDIVIISIDDEHLKALMDDYTFYTKFTIPSTTYKGMSGDANALAIKATLVCNAELSEDVVYNITKTLFEKKDALAAAYDKGKELSLESAVMGVSVPFHPGAVKYFKEKGINVQ